MDSESIAAASAIELTKLYQKGGISPVKVVETMLDRISILNPRINAFHHVSTEEALNGAIASEKRWKEGRPSSSIDGVPTAIKDGLLMKGIPVYRGSIVNNSGEQQWDIDAPVVQHRNIQLQAFFKT